VTSTRALPAGVVAYLALASCGGSGDKASTGAQTTGASTATSAIAEHVLSSNEMRGFKAASKPPVERTVGSWLAATDTPSQQVASETKRLAGLGFIAGIHEDLNGPSARQGVSIVEEFKTPDGPRSELATTVKLFKATGPKTFPVAGIPGAVGLQTTGPPAFNVAFTSGDYYYLVGAFAPKANASSKAAVVAAAKHLFQRVQG
jgi:hypothetical protein